MPDSIEQEQQFYAGVTVEEYGEPSYTKRIGPFYAEHAEELRANLEERGEVVNWIEAA